MLLSSQSSALFMWIVLPRLAGLQPSYVVWEPSPQDMCWCYGIDEGAFLRTSGNVIALSWEETISGIELLLSIGRCYLTAMKR